MPLSGIYQLLLRGLEGTSDANTPQYISREAACQELKQRTGQDFGLDSEKWREYIRLHRDRLGVARFEAIGRGVALLAAPQPSPGQARGHRPAADVTGLAPAY